MPSPAPNSSSAWSPLAPLRALLDGLRARRTRTMEDRALAERLFASFERGNTKRYKGLHFHVIDGVVTVYGSVDSEADRETVFGRIAALSGVRAVTDHLHVERPRPKLSMRLN
ncbi:MAG: BON domain-containing protein [Bacteroidota bacterium]